jgi:ABC-type multidrug transport system permease subunit
VLVVGSAFYFLVGLQLTPAKFWSAQALMVLTALNAATTGHIVGVLTPHLNYAFPLMCVVVTMMLTFCGFIGKGEKRRTW